jgi:hypothetical protein
VSADVSIVDVDGSECAGVIAGGSIASLAGVEGVESGVERVSERLERGDDVEDVLDESFQNEIPSLAVGSKMI